LATTRESELIIGLEGGGTRTTCLVVRRDGSVSGKGTGGPSNILVVGKDTTGESLSAAIRGATNNRGLDKPASVLCIGAAGSGNPEGKRLMHEVLSSLRLADRNVIVHDGVIALMGATAGKPGIVLISGTGSVCYGMNSDGEFGRASGWGYIIGDEGSGYDIARRAMVAALRAHDLRGENTVLVEKLVKRLGLSSIEGLVKKVYAEAMPRDQVSALAPLVLEATMEGDAVAEGLLKYAGRELGMAAVAVARQLKMLEGELEVATMGGILDNFGEFVLDPLQITIHNSAPRAKLVRAKFKPVVGAVIMAAREAGLTVEGDFLDNLRKDLGIMHE
jgi:N-acetylglucosamine kinase-like BadF-type ATPase